MLERRSHHVFGRKPFNMLLLRLAILLSALLLATPSHAARCGGDFNTFVQNISADAQAAGISPSVTSAALSGVQQDMAVLDFGRRRPRTLNKPFLHCFSTPGVPGRFKTPAP